MRKKKQHDRAAVPRRFGIPDAARVRDHIRGADEAVRHEGAPGE